MKPVKIFLVLAVLALAAWIAPRANTSDWRYPKMLATQIPKMPFRYFV